MIKNLTRKIALFAFIIFSIPLPAQAEEKLYHQLGGDEGMSLLVDQFLWNVAEDERINHFFVETNLFRFRNKLLEYFCMVSDGPCQYTGDSMQRTHANLDIAISDFNVVVENLIAAMQDKEITLSAQNRFLKRLAKEYTNIVKVSPVKALIESSE